MPKVKTLEFWLFALPALIVFAAWLASFDRITIVRYTIPAIAAVWMVLAIAWMGREFVRWVRD
jgi:hypothetical protein